MGVWSLLARPLADAGFQLMGKCFLSQCRQERRGEPCEPSLPNDLQRKWGMATHPWLALQHQGPPPQYTAHHSFLPADTGPFTGCPCHHTRPAGGWLCLQQQEGIAQKLLPACSFHWPWQWRQTLQLGNRKDLFPPGRCWLSAPKTPYYCSRCWAAPEN